MEKYLFLDVDGVLNHEMWYTKVVKDPELSQLRGYLRDFDPECVKRVNRIVEETGAKLVVSSSWRFDDRLLDIFHDVGLPKPYACTPVIISSTFRGDEINAFFEKRNIDPNKAAYVIIDDEDDFYRKQRKHFVGVSYIYGLNDKEVEKAIRILTSK